MVLRLNGSDPDPVHLLSLSGLYKLSAGVAYQSMPACNCSNKMRKKDQQFLSATISD